MEVEIGWVGGGVGRRGPLRMIGRGVEWRIALLLPIDNGRMLVLILCAVTDQAFQDSCEFHFCEI